MKKIISILGLFVFLYGIMPLSFVGCTDVSGDGIDSIYYGGNTLPEDKNYRNPVWEPDLDGGTIVRNASGAFIAIAGETQWAKGLTYYAPYISSDNLMEWSFEAGEAFGANTITDEEDTEELEAAYPEWAQGRIHSMAGDYARTVASTPFWLFYQIGDEQAIGAACATTVRGPYQDQGKLLDTTDTGTTEIRQPYFVVFGTSFYLLYSTEDGSYMQRVTLRRASLPTLSGNPVKIAGKGFDDVALYRYQEEDGGYEYYLFGTVKNGADTEIRYARSSDVNGPYLDKEGNSLLDNSLGTLLIQSSATIINPENVCGVYEGVVTKETMNEEGEYDEETLIYILYNATDPSKPQLASGYDRKPLFMHSFSRDEEGWFTTVVKPEIGWTSPRYSRY